MARPRDQLLYWPHVGVGLGLAMTLVGALLANNNLIAAGGNVLTFSGFFIVQRRKTK